MSSDLQGKVAIVTGAAGGIGSAVTRLLSDAGAHVVTSDLEPVEGFVSVAETPRWPRRRIAP